MSVKFSKNAFESRVPFYPISSAFPLRTFGGRHVEFHTSLFCRKASFLSCGQSILVCMNPVRRTSGCLKPTQPPGPFSPRRLLLDESNSSRRPSSPGPRASAADKPRHKFDSGAAPGRITAVNGCEVQSAVVQATWGIEAYGHDNYFLQ